MPVLLVIDDEPAILHAFRRVFCEPEITLLTARTAAQGIEQVAQHHPDVVLLDVRLPDQSGLQVFEQIRQIDADLPVIFITGHGSRATAIEAVKLGAFDFLLKPLHLRKLRKRIRQAFEVNRPKQSTRNDA